MAMEYISLLHEVIQKDKVERWEHHQRLNQFETDILQYGEDINTVDVTDMESYI